MDPLLFERLVADVAQSVYRLDEVHAYGRSGQWQGGLDIVGLKGERQIVYQVRRVDSLTADGLEKAVREYGSPTRIKDGERVSVARPFPDADEFVFVTSWPNEDTAVTDKLEVLKAEFAGDFRVRLIDSHVLSRELRFFGAIVAGYFGPYWAETFCHYTPPARAGIGNAAGLLDDPLTAIGEREEFERASSLLTSDPENDAPAAAEIYSRIARKLRENALPLADAVKLEAIRAYGAAHDYSRALNLSIEVALEDIESCSAVRESLKLADEIARSVDEQHLESAKTAVSLLRNCADWFERGYEVVDVVEKLSLLVANNAPHSARIGLLIAEQVLTDEDDRDDHGVLLSALQTLPAQLVGVDRLRLRCAIADFEIMLGARPRDAYETVRDESFTDDGLRALVERRFGRACVYVGDDTAAVNAYRRAVMHAWHAGLGGDVRKALRCVASITQVNPLFGPNTVASLAMAGARATTNRDQLISGAGQANINALDNIVSADVPDAVRWAHHWLRLERISGAERDESYARRNYARALESADRATSAVRQYINLGSRKLAGHAAGALKEFLDVTQHFASPSESRRAAAASAVAATVDLLPDADVDRVADSLASLFLTATDPARIDTDDAIASLDAIGALSERLPEDVASQIHGAAAELVPRENNQYRYIDSELLNYFMVVAQYHPSLREQAIGQLLALLAQDVGNTEQRIAARLGDIPEVRKRIASVAVEENSAAAGRILAHWQVGTPPAAAYARERIEKLMEEPLNTPKSSFVVGRSCTEASVALDATLSAGSDPDAVSLLGPWLEHLVDRIRNQFMSADERVDAAAAIQALIGRLGATEKGLAFSTCIEQFDSPKLARVDIIERANYQDPLARFKFGDGGTVFEATMLETAAMTRVNAEETRVVVDRLRSQIRLAATDWRVAELTASAAIQADAHVLANDLALSPEPRLRMAAAALWAQAPSQDPQIGEFLSTDPSTSVRRQLGAAIAAQPPEPAFEPIIAKLRTDRYASVRLALARVSAEGASPINTERVDVVET
ncbi:hypothetical protein GOPIP_077_00060 [Gordonia polyisoprenivorans NBRC 16320 = JCM 10675]|uniref:Uncharacterized protein n=1 Tax=Gordonia polyisoprenivorans TaxID=84595 RepID=A0A846WJK3_9ACTN|nr:hypothetical protein [Gordonia polyisoprenivorans]NKY01854.1 hypothetical protein [Gordonia polyisoprenivorans]GAB25081.1 hypothetical protein GOPIP_077_00060 [Gordonia polyisoprenivorans NBRC 16320 = JCM 10675]